MRVGDDQIRRRDPAGALDAEATGRAEHSDHSVARGPDGGISRDLRVRSRDVRARALDRDARVDSMQGIDQRARRRKRVVESLEDRRALDRRPQALPAGGVQCHGAEEPGEAERERDQEQRPARRFGDGDPAPAPGRAEQAPPHRDRDSLQRHRHEPADQERAREGGGGRVGRVRALRQEGRAETAAEKGADRESAEAEHADDESLLVPPESHRQGEGDDHPVEAGHGFPNTSARAITFADVNPPVTRSRTRDGEGKPPERPARPPRNQRGPLTERQRRLRQRALPLAVVALIAFVFGVISAAGSPEQDMAERFVNDWAHQDYNGDARRALRLGAGPVLGRRPAERLHRRAGRLHRDRDRSREAPMARRASTAPTWSTSTWASGRSCSARSTGPCACRSTAARSPGIRA